MQQPFMQFQNIERYLERSPLTTALSSMITSSLSPDFQLGVTLRRRIILGSGDQMRT